MTATELAALYTRDLTRLIEELQAFPDAASLWATAPGVTNAAGTLALHLEGNLREFIGRSIGGLAYTRDRPLEFSQRGVAQQALVARIQAVRETIPPVVAALSPGALAAIHPDRILGGPIPTGQFLLHLYGHLSYHLGQVDYLRRVTTGDGAITLAGL